MGIRARLPGVLMALDGAQTARDGMDLKSMGVRKVASIGSASRLHATSRTQTTRMDRAALVQRDTLGTSRGAAENQVVRAWTKGLRAPVPDRGRVIVHQSKDWPRKTLEKRVGAGSFSERPMFYCFSAALQALRCW